jgi:hypothetical protein
VGYSVNVAAQILDWKVANPEYADRYVYMQLWNEPGDARDYVPMDQFADFMVAAYQGIRNIENQYAAAHPELDLKGTIRVMTPGQNDGWDTAFNHNPQAKFSFDVWATHPYPDMTPPWVNIHDGDLPPNSLKCIDSYIQDLDEVAKTHHGVPGRRGFPVMITETNYGWFVGHSTVGWPKLTQEARGPYMADAYFEHWYRWPEIIAAHPFLLNNNKWPGFEFVHSWTSQDIEAPFGVLEPASPLPIYTAVKEAREEVEAQGRLAPARISPYRGPLGMIRGTVTRSDTGEVVPYATLSTDGYEFGHLTMFDGIYEIHDVPVGTYTLSFEKGHSYLPASQEITVFEGETTVADFSVTFTGKVRETLYRIHDIDGQCDEGCSNLNAVDHWQSFVTGPDTGFIKFASCQVHGDDVTMKFTIHEGGPGGPQVGPATYAHNPASAGDQMIGWEWPDGQEPRVQPNTRYWLHFERADGQPIYTYASNQNPYPQGDSSSSGGVDFYGTIRGLTREVNLVTGTIEGTVADGTGSPIEGATVTRLPGGISTTTAVNGSFVMNDVSVGVYDVTASKAGYAPQTVADLVVEENLTTSVELALDALPPTIALSTSNLSPSANEGDDARGETFTVRNSGSGVLDYSVSDNATWLSVNPGAGSSMGEADTITVSYATSGLAAGNYNATITISDPNATNSPYGLSVSLTVRAIGVGSVIAEDFEWMPIWSSSYDAGWGGTASWTIAGNGQTGNALQATRSSAGSSSKAMVYDIEPNTSTTITVYMRSEGWPSSYWAECAYRLGGHSAQDFDANSGAWSMIQKFSTSANGNGDHWTQYSATFDSGDNSQLTLGFKLGSTGSGPTVSWDTLRITTEGSLPTSTISLSTSSLVTSTDEGSDAPGQTFTVANSGSGTLSYSIQDDAGWLSVNPASGTSTGEADTITVTYSTAGLSSGNYNAVITVSGPGATNNPQTINVALTVNPTASLGIAEDFESMPSWTSSYDAGWGSAASWSIVGGGATGGALEAARNSAGSSSKVMVYTIEPNRTYTLSVMMRGPSSTSSYWAELAYRLGQHTGQDFDQNSGAWTMVQKFSSSTVNGNNNVWTRYTTTFSSSGNTQISVGFKLGSSGSAPTVSWDTLRIE